MAVLEQFRKDVCVYKHIVANICQAVSTSRLFTLKFYLLDHLLEDLSKLGRIFSLDTSPYKQVNTTFKAANRHKSKRCATCTDKMVFRLYQIENNAA